MAFYMIEQLEWIMNEDETYAYAYSPFGYEGRLSMIKEEGKWWAGWDLSDTAVSANIDDVKVMAQKYHENCLIPLLKEV
jgi:hypothetical protein